MSTGGEVGRAATALDISYVWCSHCTLSEVVMHRYKNE